MDVNSSLEKLFALHNFGIKLGLENTINFLNHIGNPQRDLKAIHIAGSNGKGSTASFIASILQESGFRTGLYTSPHFVKFNERIQINGVQISDQYIADFVTEHENYIDENKLTFFEVTTALAFKYFSENKIDYCVIETGLGGRLDATNVLNPLAVVITTISLEHTNVLGNSLRQIASEKAAIIKPNVKVFCGYLKYEAEYVIAEKSNQTKNELFRLADFLDENSILKVDSEEINLKNCEIPLKGKYQKLNAALACLVVVKTFGLNNRSAIGQGIRNVIKNTGITGRYEYFYKNPDIIFDSAHNIESIEQFLDEFKLHNRQYKKRALLFGVMRDKAIKQMLEILKQNFDEFHITEVAYERSATIDELRRVCSELKISAEVVNEPAEFVRKFMERSNMDCLVVLGSIYLLGEVKSKLLVDVT